MQDRLCDFRRGRVGLSAAEVELVHAAVGCLVGGRLRMANGRTIDIPTGSFTIDTGGLYDALDPNDETTLATLYAAEFPQRVESLVLVAPADRRMTVSP